MDIAAAPYIAVYLPTFDIVIQAGNNMEGCIIFCSLCTCKKTYLYVLIFDNVAAYYMVAYRRYSVSLYFIPVSL